MASAGGDHEVVWLVMLQHQPHSANIVGGVAPIAMRFEIAQVELGLKAELNACEGARDLSSDKRLTAPRRFVVEQNPIRNEKSVRFAKIYRIPVCGDFAHGVGAPGIKRRVFIL